jgi:hypothetical protein
MKKACVWPIMDEKGVRLEHNGLKRRAFGPIRMKNACVSAGGFYAVQVLHKVTGIIPQLIIPHNHTGKRSSEWGKGWGRLAPAVDGEEGRGAGNGGEREDGPVAQEAARWEVCPSAQVTQRYPDN